MILEIYSLSQQLNLLLLRPTYIFLWDDQCFFFFLRCLTFCHSARGRACSDCVYFKVSLA